MGRRVSDSRGLSTAAGVAEGENVASSSSNEGKRASAGESADLFCQDAPGDDERDDDGSGCDCNPGDGVGLGMGFEFEADEGEGRFDPPNEAKPVLSIRASPRVGALPEDDNPKPSKASLLRGISLGLLAEVDETNDGRDGVEGARYLLEDSFCAGDLSQRPALKSFSNPVEG